MRGVDSQALQPDLRCGPVLVQPCDRPAGRMKALLSASGELPHRGARGMLVRLRIDCPDDGEVDDLAGIAIEHEAIGFSVTRLRTKVPRPTSPCR